MEIQRTESRNGKSQYRGAVLSNGAWKSAAAAKSVLNGHEAVRVWAKISTLTSQTYELFARPLSGDCNDVRPKGCGPHRCAFHTGAIHWRHGLPALDGESPPPRVLGRQRGRLERVMSIYDAPRSICIADARRGERGDCHHIYAIFLVLRSESARQTEHALNRLRGGQRIQTQAPRIDRRGATPSSRPVFSLLANRGAIPARPVASQRVMEFGRVMP